MNRRKIFLTLCVAVGLAAPLVGVAAREAYAQGPGECGTCDGTPRICGLVTTVNGGFWCYGYGSP
jgi:hypothetical protein